MKAKGATEIIGIKWITRGETRQIIHAKAKTLGISGVQFARDLKSGRVSNHKIDVHPGTYELATLCSFIGGEGARKKRR